MINKEELESALTKVAADMQQLVMNYNVLQGQHQTLTALIGKFAPGVEKMADGVVEVAEGVGHIAEGMIDVVNEIGIE